MKQALTLDRTTKNTVVYKAPKGSAVDTLYVQKDAFPNGGYPNEIEIQITEKVPA